MLDDEMRLRLLAELGFEYAEADFVLDVVAALAAQVCGTPMAAVSLVGRDEQVFIGATGLAVDRTDRDLSFCAVAMQQPDSALLVPDTHLDARFATNALVLGAPHIRAYAGVPLVADDEVPLGAVCVLNDQPQSLTDEQVGALRALGVITEHLLQGRRTARRLEASVAEAATLREAELSSREQLRVAFDHATIGMTLADHEGRYVRVNQVFADLLGFRVEELAGCSFSDVTHAEDTDADVTVTRSG